MTVNITIFSSGPVAYYCWENYNQDDQRAAKVVKPHIEAALDYWGYDHNVQISGDTTYESQKSTMGEERDYFRDVWLDGHSDKSSDSNLMLLDQEPSGAAGKADIGGPAALLKYSTDLPVHSLNADRYGDPNYDSEGRIRGAVHEIGHNLGMRHGDGLRYDSSGTTYATPHGCEMDFELQEKNSCGHTCSQSSRDMFDHYFADCAENNI